MLSLCPDLIIMQKYEYKCSVEGCAFTAKTANQMTDHYASKHGKRIGMSEIDRMRTYSDNAFDLMNLDNLVTSDKRSGEYKCTLCNAFKHPQDFTVFNHINAAHFKTVYFQCKGEDCTFRTFWRSHLVKHFRRVHKGGEGELSARDIMESQVIGSHVDLHLFSHNKFSATRENRLPKTVMVEDYPSFRCPYDECDHEDSKWSSVSAHIESKHEWTSVYRCGMFNGKCDYVTQNRSTISSHIR